MKVKIYFETGPLDWLHKINYELNENLYVVTSDSGYRNMIRDTRTACKNGRNIYTNELSLIGAAELWGRVFMHEIWLKDNDSQKWHRMNPRLIERLRTPLEIQEYIRKYICVDKKV